MNEEQYHSTEFAETAGGENPQQYGQMGAQRMEEGRFEPALGDTVIDELQSRWNSVQIEFVDGPRTSVEQAQALVAETVEKIAQMLSEKRASLDGTWANREDISTEDLRTALQRYRSFFNRLLRV